MGKVAALMKLLPPTWVDKALRSCGEANMMTNFRGRDANDGADKKKN